MINLTGFIDHGCGKFTTSETAQIAYFSKRQSILQSKANNKYFVRLQ